MEISSSTTCYRSYERYTRGYRDPNVETLVYSFEADIWAAAITLLEMETGIRPESDSWNMSLRSGDASFNNLIDQMLLVPMDRVTAEQALILLDRYVY